jgi:hypothetical protein
MPVWQCGHRHRSRGEAIRCQGGNVHAGTRTAAEPDHQGA